MRIFKINNEEKEGEVKLEALLKASRHTAQPKAETKLIKLPDRQPITF